MDVGLDAFLFVEVFSGGRGGVVFVPSVGGDVMSVGYKGNDGMLRVA